MMPLSPFAVTAASALAQAASGQRLPHLDCALPLLGELMCGRQRQQQPQHLMQRQEQAPLRLIQCLPPECWLAIALKRLWQALQMHFRGLQRPLRCASQPPRPAMSAAAAATASFGCGCLGCLRVHPLLQLLQKRVHARSPC